jgi:uncharacterized protein (DUF1501 family)
VAEVLLHATQHQPSVGTSYLVRADNGGLIVRSHQSNRQLLETAMQLSGALREQDLEDLFERPLVVTTEKTKSQTPAVPGLAVATTEALRCNRAAESATPHHADSAASTTAASRSPMSVRNSPASDTRSPDWLCASPMTRHKRCPKARSVSYSCVGR